MIHASREKCRIDEVVYLSLSWQNQDLDLANNEKVFIISSNNSALKRKKNTCEIFAIFNPFLTEVPIVDISFVFACLREKEEKINVAFKKTGTLGSVSEQSW